MVLWFTRRPFDKMMSSIDVSGNKPGVPEIDDFEYGPQATRQLLQYGSDVNADEPVNNADSFTWFANVRFIRT